VGHHLRSSSPLPVPTVLNLAVKSRIIRLTERVQVVTRFKVEMVVKVERVVKAENFIHFHLNF
jgi:hypothetical protein